ncbi:hypothetical protein FRC05_007023 [Tulasnella sp. 425]|nr:hypothetical protein FRC05_007023 [Tulasnella sp. 425]
MVQKQLVDEIMAKMTARGMEPNRVTRNFLLLAALKADDKAGTDQAMQIWRETIADKGNQDHIPHTTYFTLLNGLAKNGRYDCVQEVMEHIYRSGWQPKGSLEKLLRQLSREIALRDSALQELEPYKIPLERLKMADTEIGKGGFGTVTLAELHSLDDPSDPPITVAVKEIRDDTRVLPLRLAYTPTGMHRDFYEK